MLINRKVSCSRPLRLAGVNVGVAISPWEIFRRKDKVGTVARVLISLWCALDVLLVEPLWF
jgi:hypothetical protein